MLSQFCFAFQQNEFGSRDIILFIKLLLQTFVLYHADDVRLRINRLAVLFKFFQRIYIYMLYFYSNEIAIFREIDYSLVIFKRTLREISTNTFAWRICIFI